MSSDAALSPALVALTQYLTTQQAELAKLRAAVQPLPVAAQVAAEVALKTQDQGLYSQLTQEENEAVLAKMCEVAQKPAGHLPTQEQLYLEQQLADLLGFEVTAELEGHRLNHSVGVMASMPHLRRHPTDLLSEHSAWTSAGLATKRGSFGWFTEQGQLTPKSILREKYFFAVQAMFLEEWSSHFQELREWLKFRKMVMINPFEAKAVVGCVGTLGPADWLQKQFGGSPEVIQEGLVWSPATRGRVLLFFVNDFDDQVPLGVHNLLPQGKEQP